MKVSRYNTSMYEKNPLDTHIDFRSSIFGVSEIQIDRLHTNFIWMRLIHTKRSSKVSEDVSMRVLFL